MIGLMTPDEISGVVEGLNYGDVVKLYPGGVPLQVDQVSDGLVYLTYATTPHSQQHSDYRLRVSESTVECDPYIDGVGWGDEWDTITWITEVDLR